MRRSIRSVVLVSTLVTVSLGSPACSDDDRDAGRDRDDRSTIADGDELYATRCASCHGADGSGTANVFPALAGDPLVVAEDPTAAILTVLNGRGGMPRWADELSDAEIAAILSYVRTSFGNHASEVTTQEVARLRAEQGSHPADH